MLIIHVSHSFDSKFQFFYIMFTYSLFFFCFSRLLFGSFNNFMFLNVFFKYLADYFLPTLAIFLLCSAFFDTFLLFFQQFFPFVSVLSAETSSLNLTHTNSFAFLILLSFFSSSQQRSSSIKHTHCLFAGNANTFLFFCQALQKVYVD